MKINFYAATTLAALATALPVAAQQGDGTEVAISVHVVKPDKAEAAPDRIAQIKTPEGFTVKPFATGLKNARIIAVAPNGDIYVSRREQGMCCC